IHYSTQKLKCRSQVLLQYFGEDESVRCGNCDVCLERNELGLSKLEFDRLAGEIRENLEEACAFEELIMKLKGNEDRKIKVIRWLMDNGKIVKRIDNKLEWKRNQQ